MKVATAAANKLTTAEVADRLGMSETTVRTFCKVGYLVGQTSSGSRGRGQRYYFDPVEVEAFARGGAPAAKAYRETQTTRKGKR